MKRFNRLYNFIMQNTQKYSDEEKQQVMDVLKKFKLDGQWGKYIDIICKEMYDGHKYGKVQLQQIDEQGVKAILKDVKDHYLDDHKEELAEVEESKKVDKSKKVIKEDTNPDVQDQADCLNGFMEDHPEIDWEYAADYELDAELNTALFYLNDDAEQAWNNLGDFATDEWDEEEDDHVYVSGEELFRDAYRYKFCCGIFYLADELYDFVMKYGSGDDKVIAELDAMRNDFEDIIYIDWYDEGPDFPDFQLFVDKCVGYLGTLCGKFSDIDKVKFDVLRQIASEIR